MLNRFIKRMKGNQEGITGLETAIILIAFVVVAAVFAYTVLSAGLRIGFMEEGGEELVFLDLRPRSESSETLNDFMQSGFMVAGASCTWVAAPRAAET